MAKTTSIQLLDDISGDPAVETIHFALDGTRYEIDLSGTNARGLRDLLAPYAAHGRRTGGRRRVGTGTPEPARPAQPTRRTQSGDGAAASKPTRKAQAASTKKDAVAGKAAGRKNAATAKTTARSTTAKTTAKTTAAAATAAPAERAGKTNAASGNATNDRATRKKAPTKAAGRKADQSKTGATSKQPAKKAVRKAPPVTFSAATG